MHPLPRRVAWSIALAALVASALSGCAEGLFRDDADRQVYRLERDRQRQVLGGPSETRIGYGEIPTTLGPTGYEKVPPTLNDIAAAVRTATTEGASLAPDPEAPSTEPAAAGSLEALLNQGAAIELDKMPDLPAFPRPVPKGKTRRVFNLDNCWDYSLAHSRDYMSRKEDLYIAALDVTLQRHAFEPRLFAQTGVNVAGKGEASDYAAALNAFQTVGVRQKLPYGGEVVASAVATSVNQLRATVNESERADLILQANIPLLRGAGMVAQESLIQSERNLVYEVRDFERYRRAFLVSVASQYFSLVNQRAQILNRFRNVASYTFIRKRSEALFKAGRPRTSLLDVQRAAQSELQARNDLINAIESYELAVDNFKLLLGMPTEEPLDIAPQYLDISPPTITEPAAVQIADRLRLDLQTIRDRVEDARRTVKVAKNNLLPDLNLNAKADLGSNPDKKTLAVNGRDLDYLAGATLDWPLDRLAERNAFRTALINLDRAKRSVEQLEDQAAIEVRSAVRRVRQQQFIVALQRNNIALAQRRKAFADIQFRDGKIDNRDYLDAETALLTAQNQFAQAVSGLQTAVLAYLRDTDQLRVDPAGKLLIPDKAAGIAPGAATQPGTQPGTPPTTQPGTQPALPPAPPAPPPATLPAGAPDAVVPQDTR